MIDILCGVIGAGGAVITYIILCYIWDHIEWRDNK